MLQVLVVHRLLQGRGRAVQVGVVGVGGHDGQLLGEGEGGRVVEAMTDDGVEGGREMGGARSLQPLLLYVRTRRVQRRDELSHVRTVSRIHGGLKVSSPDSVSQRDVLQERLIDDTTAGAKHTRQGDALAESLVLKKAIRNRSRNRPRHELLLKLELLLNGGDRHVRLHERQRRHRGGVQSIDYRLREDVRIERPDIGGRRRRRRRRRSAST